MMEVLAWLKQSLKLYRGSRINLLHYDCTFLHCIMREDLVSELSNEYELSIVHTVRTALLLGAGASIVWTNRSSV